MQGGPYVLGAAAGPACGAGEWGGCCVLAPYARAGRPPPVPGGAAAGARPLVVVWARGGPRRAPRVAAAHRARRPPLGTPGRGTPGAGGAARLARGAGGVRPVPVPGLRAGPTNPLPRPFNPAHFVSDPSQNVA
ncbi:hypothetical protein GCM10009544_09710 [Streptomyces stramineus]|uniref:Uncharacterized protein n=1 Tax=Streptomyces stramineus TaxID=173861 RepID=A0ABN0ZII7_9ACTN